MEAEQVSQNGLAPLDGRRPSLATRMALTFLTPSSINNARACAASDRTNIHHHVLPLPILD
jgi:hypothetical protein